MSKVPQPLGILCKVICFVTYLKKGVETSVAKNCIKYLILRTPQDLHEEVCSWFIEVGEPRLREMAPVTVGEEFLIVRSAYAVLQPNDEKFYPQVFPIEMMK